MRFGGDVLDFLKRPTVIIVILGLVFGTGFYIYNNYRQKKAAQTASTVTDTPAATVADLTNADPKDFATELTNELTLANQKAIAYNTKEALSAIEIKIPGKLIPRSGNSTYIFDQPQDTGNHFTINISQATSSFIRAVIPKDDYFGSLTTINLKSWKLSYIDALKVAEKNGGQDWRKNNTLSELQLTLKNAQPKGWLYWFVKYASESSGFEVQVDAYSGRFVPAAETQAAPAATTEQSTTSQ